jgi:hypothetical protein
MPFKIAIISPTGPAERKPREDIAVKGEVTVEGGGMGPESITVKIERGKGREFGSFGLVPNERNKSYEFEAGIKAPKQVGKYEIICVGIYQTLDRQNQRVVKRIRSAPLVLNVKE